MARNIEIKAQLRDCTEAHAIAQRLSGGEPTRIEQRDEFFLCAHGRLKLRHFGEDQGELIQYDRTNEGVPRVSDYERVRTYQADALGAILRRALGTTGVVEKTRWLYLVGQTRVHIDEVRDLGTFIELEVVLQPEQAEAEGKNIAEALMRDFGITAEDIIPDAYIDLLGKGSVSAGVQNEGGTPS